MHTRVLNITSVIPLYKYWFEALKLNACLKLSTYYRSARTCFINEKQYFYKFFGQVYAIYIIK